MTTSLSRTSHRRPWLVTATVAATVAATALVPAGTASASWHSSSSTLIEFRDVCRDGIRFGGAVRDGSGPATGAYKNRAVAAQPAPATWVGWKDGGRPGEVMNTGVEIPANKTTVETDDQGTVQTVDVSHEGSFTKRYRNRPLKLELVALNLEDGNPDSSLNAAAVTDCFLYAPIDVQPGQAANKVPIGKGQVSVAALASKVMSAKSLTPSKFRFGPGRAVATGSQLRDVNGDGRKDLVLRFRSTDAGLTCSTKSVLLVGKTATGGTYEGKDKVKPTGC